MDTPPPQKLLTRDFTLAFLAQFAFAAIFQLLLPTLPIYLSRQGATEIEIGVLVGIFGFISVICRPFIGKALTKVSERTFMIVGSLLNGATSAAYLVIPIFWPLLILRLFQGIAFAFYHTSSITFIANISPVVQRARILGYFSLAMNVAAAVAPPLGMFIINRFSFTHLFLVCTAIAVCQLVLSQRLGTRRIVPPPDQPATDGFFLSREALAPSIINSLALFLWAALTAFFPLYAVGRGMTNPGLFFTTMAIMLILGRGLGGRILDTYSKEKILIPCLAACVLAMGLLAFSGTQFMFIVVAVIWGAGHAFLMPTLMAYTLERVASAGHAMGTFTAVSDLGLFLGPLTMGVLIHYTSYRAMFLCLALIGALNLAYFLVFVRKRAGRAPARASEGG
jgi:MFS family permease